MSRAQIQTGSSAGMGELSISKQKTPSTKCLSQLPHRWRLNDALEVSDEIGSINGGSCVSGRVRLGGQRTGVSVDRNKLHVYIESRIRRRVRGHFRSKPDTVLGNRARQWMASSVQAAPFAERTCERPSSLQR